MPRTLYAALAVTASLLLAGPALAQDVDANLVGTWVVSDFFGKTWRGTTVTMDSVTAIEIEITEHDGPTFVGVIRWEFNSDEHGLHDGTQTTAMAEEKLLGVRDFDGTYVVVEQSDTSIRRYRLVDANTLESVAYEAGPHAVVVRSTYTRR